MMAPLAQSPWLAAVGFVASTAALVVVGACARSPRSEQRSRARRSCGFDAQLCGELAQVRRHVDVVPGLGESHRQSERSCVLEAAHRERCPCRVAPARRVADASPTRRRDSSRRPRSAPPPRRSSPEARRPTGGLASGRCGLSLSSATTRGSTGTNCSKAERAPRRARCRICPTTCTPAGKRASMSATSSTGHITATWTRESFSTSVNVSRSMHSASRTTSRAGYAPVSLVFTKPSRGALAITTTAPPNAVRSAIDPAAAHVAGSAGLVTARSRFFAIPLRMHQAAPIEPFHVPLIFETPMRGW